ncbi:MAG: ABC transporter permease [Acidimicrobiales bacterium]|nr:ABC transporter permease [Acidimicrobiales bacterium]MBO0885938.1 ABC transporter permease [Acidimicrobiales bacterium]MBO0893265.1 ABC transporter permease [Acidimicrobiales bacterium]
MGTARAALPRAAPRRVALGWAFVERQTNLWKRYWGWELVWLLYGVVNTLSITFIAKEAGRSRIASPAQVPRLVLFLLIGTLVWAYLSAVLDDMSLVVMWERWEGTIEHTLMAPVSRVVHLVGMSIFGVVHATVRTVLILACSLPFFALHFAHTSWLAAGVIVLVGSVSLVGLGILTSILPLLYPERGEQMSFMVQAVVLLVSGVYYDVGVLPGWLQSVSRLSPATYILRGIRQALISGAGVGDQLATIGILAAFGVVMVPGALVAFAVAERWAKKTGRLKRQG